MVMDEGGGLNGHHHALERRRLRDGHARDLRREPRTARPGVTGVFQICPL